MKKRSLQPLIGIALIAIVAAVLAKDLIAKAVVTSGVRSVTGLKLGIGSMSVGVLRSALGIRQLTVHNPSGFPDRYMVELPEIYVDYDLGALLGRRVHLEEVRIHLKQLTVVKDAQGRLNLDSLKVVRESKQQAAKPAVENAPPAPPQIQIDRLHLRIGTVVYKDYAAGSTPAVQEFPVNIDERYEHITSPQVLASLILSRALMKTTVARLTGFDAKALQAQLTAQLEQATSAAAQEAVGAANKAMKKIFGQ